MGKFFLMLWYRGSLKFSLQKEGHKSIFNSLSVRGYERNFKGYQGEYIFKQQLKESGNKGTILVILKVELSFKIYK